MKITVDTNVLISSTFWNGNSDKIIKLAENNKIELILSEEIIEEFIKVLNYKEIQEKIKDKNLEMKRSVEKIVSISKIVIPKLKINISEDSDDNKILECAVEGKADYIISQDNHLLKLKEYNKIKILTPKEFLEIFQRMK
ncbi:MAG: putative toxin-antitoxin system toxin component, PIN family [Nanoarchaeota archaeon]|nr:putative toxin-antitoxin system toxin component, PIN family [Nanoarchaeota archaeon]